MFLIEPKCNDAMINHDFKALFHKICPTLIPRNPGNNKKILNVKNISKNVTNTQITAKLSIKQTFVNPYISDHCTPT